MRTGLGYWVAAVTWAMVIIVSGCNSPQSAEPVSAVTMPASSARECSSPDLKVSNYSLYTDDNGQPWVIGKVFNTSKLDLVLPRVCIVLSGSNVSQTMTRYIGPMLIRAGEAIAFQARIDALPPEKHYQVRLGADAQPTSLNPEIISHISRRFETSQLIPTLRLDITEVTVSGVVTNTSRLPVNNIFISIGLFDKKGTLVGVATSKITDLQTTAPGGSVPFTVTTNHLLNPFTRLALQTIVEAQTSPEGDE